MRKLCVSRMIYKNSLEYSGSGISKVNINPSKHKKHHLTDCFALFDQSNIKVEMWLAQRFSKG